MQRVDSKHHFMLLGWRADIIGTACSNHRPRNHNVSSAGMGCLPWLRCLQVSCCKQLGQMEDCNPGGARPSVSLTYQHNSHQATHGVAIRQRPWTCQMHVPFTLMVALRSCLTLDCTPYVALLDCFQALISRQHRSLTLSACRKASQQGLRPMHA